MQVGQLRAAAYLVESCSQVFVAVPQARKAVAEHLYVWLLSQQGCHPDSMGLDTDAACDVLCKPVWDGSLQEAKTAREPLYSLLQLLPRLHSVRMPLLRHTRLTGG